MNRKLKIYGILVLHFIFIGIILLIGFTLILKTNNHAHQLTQINYLEDQILDLRLNLNKHQKYKQDIYLTNCEKSFSKIYRKIESLKIAIRDYSMNVDISHLDKKIKEYHDSFYEYTALSKEDIRREVDLDGKYTWAIYYFNLYSIQPNDPIYTSFSQANGFAKSAFISIIEGDSGTLTRDYYAMNYNLTLTLNKSIAIHNPNISNAISKYKSSTEIYLNTLKQLSFYQLKLDKIGDQSKDSVSNFFLSMDNELYNIKKYYMILFIIAIIGALITGIYLANKLRNFVFNNYQDNKSQKTLTTSVSASDIRNNYIVTVIKNEIVKLKEDSDQLYQQTELTREHYRQMSHSLISLNQNIMNLPENLCLLTGKCTEINDCLNNLTNELDILQTRLQSQAAIFVNSQEQNSMDAPNRLTNEEELQHQTKIKKLKTSIELIKNFDNNQVIQEIFQQFLQINILTDHNLENARKTLKLLSIHFHEHCKITDQNESYNTHIQESLKSFHTLQNDFSSQVDNYFESLQKLANQVTKLFLAIRMGEHE